MSHDSSVKTTVPYQTLGYPLCHWEVPTMPPDASPKLGEETRLTSEPMMGTALTLATGNNGGIHMAVKN